VRQPAPTVEIPADAHRIIASDLTMPVRRRRYVVVALVVAGLALAAGITVTVLMQSSVTVSHPVPADAASRFAALRQRFQGARPLIEIADKEGTGRLVVHRDALPATPAPVTTVRGLAWRASNRTLADVRLPFWFIRLKLAGGRATLGALLPAGWEIVDLAPDDLVRHGPGLLLDEQAANGDRLLLWAE
jgi:hypothetical protein